MTAAFHQDRARADAAAEKLKIYAQPQRLMILSYLLRGESAVSDIDAATTIGQPALSQQLAALRRADIVKTRREGKQIWYDLADDAARLCVKTMEAILKDKPDEQQLVKAVTERAAPVKTKPAASGAASFAKII